MSDKIEISEEFQELLDKLPADEREKVMKEMEENRKSSDIFISDMVDLIMGNFATITSRIPFPEDFNKINIEDINNVIKSNWEYYLKRIQQGAFTIIMTSLSFYTPTYNPNENSISFKKTKLDS